MDIKSIKEKVEEITKAKNIHEQEVYSKIFAFLDTAYNYTIPTSEENLILEEIKTKILKTIYSKDRHKLVVNQRTEYRKLFDLDEIEMKLLERAFQELEVDGKIASLMYEISLTEKGIMTARNL